MVDIYKIMVEIPYIMAGSATLLGRVDTGQRRVCGHLPQPQTRSCVCNSSQSTNVCVRCCQSRVYDTKSLTHFGTEKSQSLLYIQCSLLSSLMKKQVFINVLALFEVFYSFFENTSRQCSKCSREYMLNLETSLTPVFSHIAKLDPNMLCLYHPIFK